MNLKKHRIADAEVFSIYKDGDKFRAVFKDPDIEPFVGDDYNEVLAEAQRKASGDDSE